MDRYGHIGHRSLRHSHRRSSHWIAWALWGTSNSFILSHSHRRSWQWVAWPIWATFEVFPGHFWTIRTADVHLRRAWRCPKGMYGCVPPNLLRISLELNRLTLSYLTNHEANLTTGCINPNYNLTCN
jgi:hypothetical protein